MICENGKSLRTRLSGLYRDAEVTMVEGTGCFCCRKIKGFCTVNKKRM